MPIVKTNPKTGLRKLKPNESFSYNRATGEQKYSQPQAGDPNSKDRNKITFGESKLSDERRMEILQSGNVSQIGLEESNYARKNLINKLTSEGKTPQEIQQIITTPQQPTPQTATVGTQPIQPTVTQPTIENQPMGEQPQFDEQQMRNILAFQEETQPYKSIKQNLAEGLTKQLFPEDTKEKTALDYAFPLFSMMSGWNGQFMKGIYQTLDASTMQIKGITRKIGVADTLTTLESGWKANKEAMELNIKAIENGDPNVNPNDIITDLMRAKTIFIEYEGYVHGFGSKDPKYMVEEGIGLEDEYNNILRELNDYIPRIMEAQEQAKINKQQKQQLEMQQQQQLQQEQQQQSQEQQNTKYNLT